MSPTIETAPPGYRRLEVGEAIQDGDKFYFLGQLYNSVAIHIQKHCGGFEITQYYRPIPQAPTPNWMADSRPLLAEIAALSAQRDVMESALRVGIQEMTHDIPGSCWSTGPMTGTAEDDLCRGCLFLSKARTALASLEVTRG